MLSFFVNRLARVVPPHIPLRTKTLGLAQTLDRGTRYVAVDTVLRGPLSIAKHAGEHHLSHRLTSRKFSTISSSDFIKIIGPDSVTKKIEPLLPLFDHAKFLITKDPTASTAQLASEYSIILGYLLDRCGVASAKFCASLEPIVMVDGLVAFHRAHACLLVSIASRDYVLDPTVGQFTHADSHTIFFQPKGEMTKKVDSHFIVPSTDTTLIKKAWEAPAYKSDQPLLRFKLFMDGKATIPSRGYYSRELGFNFSYDLLVTLRHYFQTHVGAKTS